MVDLTVVDAPGMVELEVLLPEGVATRTLELVLVVVLAVVLELFMLLDVWATFNDVVADDVVLVVVLLSVVVVVVLLVVVVVVVVLLLVRVVVVDVLVLVVLDFLVVVVGVESPKEIPPGPIEKSNCLLL